MKKKTDYYCLGLIIASLGQSVGDEWERKRATKVARNLSM